MSYAVCLEQSYIPRTLKKSKPHNLAIIDTNGISRYEINYACARGVWVYGYINSDAL